MSDDDEKGPKGEVEELEARWATDGSALGGDRAPVHAEEVVRLRGSVRVEHTLARRGAERLWKAAARSEEPVRTFGALTGAQAVQMVKAGLEAIYLSGWQVAGDMNLAGQTYPDQSLYPANSVPRWCAAEQRAAARGPDRVGGEGESAATGWCPSSPTPRPASAGRCTPSS
jgi:isocitrate lyase